MHADILRVIRVGQTQADLAVCLSLTPKQWLSEERLG